MGYHQPEFKVLAVNPGGGESPYWQTWLEGQHLSVGDSDWDLVPDLRTYEDKETFYAAYREHGWGDRKDGLWNIRELSPGDYVLAIRGQSFVLGLGIVQSPGYFFQPDAGRHRHRASVAWDISLAREVPQQKGWLAAVNKVELLKFETWFGDRSESATWLRTLASASVNESAFDPSSTEDGRRRIIASVVARQGQSKFRNDLLERYGGRCMVSGCEVEAALEAAHISPYRGERTNHPANGLLLRADLHTLFDLWLLSVDEEWRVLLHPSIHQSSYSDLMGRRLILPSEESNWPSRDALADHRKCAKL